ncbi:hypothetical protein [Pseudomonas putida]|uniref:hypothetical protein n=1 Tax=Pseudomonas putida TaxID=303 RepID=UPI001EE35892|nr:hypothetical protein [Pseudomonas putida]
MNSDAVIKLITEQLRPEMYCLVLVDPLAVREDSHLSILARVHETMGESAITRVYRADLPPEPALHPALICLSSPGMQPCPSLLKATAEAALHDVQRRKRHVCGWLLSKTPPARIAYHITALCRLPNETGATSFSPVYEPLRLELLVALLQQPEHGPWWPIEHWVFLTSGGRLASLNGHPNSRSDLPAATTRVLGDVALIEALLAARRVLLSRPRSPELLPLPTLAAVRASNHIEDARRLGLSEQEDILVLALHQLCLHPDIHKLAAVQRLIDTCIRLRRPLSSLLSTLSAATWDRMIATLPPARPHS